MATIKLLELNRWNGLKGNVICQLLAPSRSISLDNVEEKKSYMVIVDNGVRYCLTGNEGVYDEDSSYVILTDRTPTRQKLINGQIKQKRWIKHP